MGLPPNQTKGNGESSFLTTFKVDYDKTPVTRTGVEIKIGTTPISMGGTGSTTKNFVDLTTSQTIAGVKTFSSTIAGSVSGNSATVTTNANLTGEVTSVGNATAVTNAAVISKVLTGFTPATGIVAPTDSVIQALQKIDANTTGKTLQQVYNSSTSPQVVTSVTKGSLDLKNGSNLDTDAVLKVLSGAGDDVASIDGLGNLNASNVVITNYIQDPKCELPTPYLWSSSAPINNPITISNSNVLPLRGSRSRLLVKPASNCKDSYCEYTIVIDPADRNKMLKISFDYIVASGDYRDGDIEIQITDNDTYESIASTPSKIQNVIGPEPFFAEFQTRASLSYTITMLVMNTDTRAFSLKFDNFFCGRGVKAYGSPIIDPTSYTPIISPNTNTTSSIFWGKEGKYMIITGRITWSGTGVTGAITVPIPTGKVIDYSIAPEGNVAGVASGLESLVQFTAGQVIVYSPTELIIRGHVSGSIASNKLAIDNNLFLNPPLINSYITFSAKIPIQGWSSSTLMSSDADTRVVAASVGLDGTYSLATTLDTILPINTAFLDRTGMFDVSGNRVVIRVPGTYKLSTNLIFNNATTGTRFAYIFKTGTGSPIARGSSPPASVYETIVHASTIVEAIAGDSFYIGAFQNSGSPLGIEGGDKGSKFLVERISGPSQISASESVGARYIKNGSQSLTAGAPTKITSWSRDFDSHGMWDAANNRIKAPSSGTYELVFKIFGVTTGTTTSQIIAPARSISGGGAVYIGGGIAFSDNTYQVIGTDTFKMKADEYVELYTYSGLTGATVDGGSNSYWTFKRVGNY